MLENYFPDTASSEQKQRVIAVNAALELIKVTLADSKENCILQHVWTCEAEHTGGTIINKQSVYLLSVPFFIWNDRRALK